MANTRSDIITSLLATPPLMVNTMMFGGRKKYARAEFPTLAAEAANHFYPLIRIPADWCIIKMEVSNTADAGMTDLDVGPYVAGNWNLADQAVITGSTLDKFVDGANRAAATTQPVNIWGTGTNSFAENLQGKPLWVQAGLATQPTPGTVWDIVLKAVGASNPAGGGIYVVEFELQAND